MNEPTPHTPIRQDDIERPIGRRFERMVAAHAHRVAVKTASHVLTYEALGRLAGRFAAAISPDRRDGRAAPVALLFAHDAPLIAAILGCVQAGRPYVYLDPKLPEARRAAILAHSLADTLVTDAASADAVPAGFGGRVVGTDGLPDEGGCAGGPLPETSDGAYCLVYTSGTTGRPKGVLQGHRALLFNIMRYSEALGIRPEDRMTLLSPAGFAAASSAIFGALLNGACLLPFDVRKEGLHRMHAWMVEEALTLYHAAPTLFRTFAGSLPEDARFPALRVVKLGGETVHPADVELFKSRFEPPCVLVNGLGMTEAAGNICYFFIDHATEVEGPRVPIGYPIEGRDVVLVGEDGAPVDAGEVGEITVRSAYLASGYWRAPELTAARFRPLPSDGTTCLRTGEFARRLADGCLEHHGRRDRQVQIRGFRVEVAEVEQVLLEHVAVAACAVVVRGEDEGEPSLVAYVVPAGDELAGTVLRDHLRERLPAYMVPSAFVVLDRLPLTPNGKLDRGALPEPAPGAREATYAEPRDHLELQLVHIWEDVLQTRPVGVDDDFFDVGGHSLLAIRLLARVEERFGRALPLDALVRASTVRSLALLLRRDEVEDASLLVAVQPEGDRPPFFCVPPLAEPGMVFARLARLVGREQPFYSFSFPPVDPDLDPRRWLASMIAAYVVEVRRLQPKGPYYLGGRCFGGRIALEMAQILIAEGERVALLAIMDNLPRLSVRLPTLKWRRRAAMLFRRLVYNRREGWLPGLLGRGTPLEEEPIFRRIAGAYVGAAQSRHAQGVLAAYRQVREGFRIRRVYPGRITFVQNEDWQRRNAWIQAQWALVAGAGLEVHVIPGAHEDMLRREASVEVLARTLRDCLDEAQK